MKKLIAWAHTPVGDSLCLAVMALLALVGVHRISWLLWAMGWR